MSLVTTCPACGTAFHVEPAQLAVHRGDVGCGRCGHVFNALERLTEIEPPVPELEPPAEPSRDATAELPAPELPPAGNLETAAPPAEPPETGLPTAVTPAAEPTPVSEAASSEPVEPPPTAAAEMAAEPPATPQEPPLLPPPAARWPQLTEEPAQPPRRRHAARWLLPPLALLLLLAVFAQAAYFLRSDLAARLPQLRPALQQACGWLGCRIGLPHDEQLLSIDDSDLHRDDDHDGVYLLTATLSNRARHVQAYPLLEVTLTDLDDVPVLRRMLPPSAYLPAGSDPAAGFAAGGELQVRLAFALDGINASGYRLFVTYP